MEGGVEQRVTMLGLERLRITSVLYWVLNFGLVIVASIREPAGYLRRWSFLSRSVRFVVFLTSRRP